MTAETRNPTFRLGRQLPKAWINVDLIWAAALVVTGIANLTFTFQRLRSLPSLLSPDRAFAVWVYGSSRHVNESSVDRV